MSANRLRAGAAKASLWLAGATFSLFLGLVTNSLSGDRISLPWWPPLVASAGLLATSHFVRPRFPPVGVILGAVLSHWAQEWVLSAELFVRHVRVPTTRVLLTIRSGDLVKRRAVDDLVGGLREWRGNLVESTGRDDSIALLHIAPTPVAFALGARLRDFTSVRLYQQRARSRRNDHAFFEAVDVRKLPHRAVGWRPWLSVDLVQLAGSSDAREALVIDVSKNSVRRAAVDHAGQDGFARAVVIDFARPGPWWSHGPEQREIPETRRAMTGLTRACELLVQEQLAVSAGRRAALTRLYIRMPVSMAFALGQRLRITDIELYYQPSPQVGFVRVRAE
jgi:hypothetical protein